MALSGSPYIEGERVTYSTPSFVSLLPGADDTGVKKRTISKGDAWVPQSVFLCWPPTRPPVSFLPTSRSPGVPLFFFP